MKVKNIIILGAAVGLMTAMNAMATLTFVTSGTTSGGSVSGQADFTLNNGSLTLVLQNTYTGSYNSIAQLLSGITFTVSGASGSGALTTVNSGEIGTVSTSGITDLGSDPLTRWKATETGTSINMNLFGTPPDRLIIGTGADYSGINSSISTHNPAVLGFATFNITIPGITANSTISNVIFQFGTTPGTDTTPGTPKIVPSVPEPSTVIAGALLLLPFGVQTIRQLRKRNS